MTGFEFWAAVCVRCDHYRRSHREGPCQILERAVVCGVNTEVECPCREFVVSGVYVLGPER